MVELYNIQQTSCVKMQFRNILIRNKKKLFINYLQNFLSNINGIITCFDVRKKNGD